MELILIHWTGRVITGDDTKRAEGHTDQGGLPWAQQLASRINVGNFTLGKQIIGTSLLHFRSVGRSVEWSVGRSVIIS